MYSRYEENSKRPIRLPEHYGGSVFSQQQQPTAAAKAPKREVSRAFPRDGVGEKASPVAERLLRAEVQDEKDTIPTLETLVSDANLHIEEPQNEPKEQAQDVPPPKKATPYAINFEGIRRLLGDGEGDKDRLLLLGLILLLSRTDGDSDILLWLSLLLLCG